MWHSNCMKTQFFKRNLVTLQIRRWVANLVTFVTVLTISSTLSNSSTAETVPSPNEASKSVFMVTSILFRTGGTGFVINVRGEPRILTNRHVCESRTTDGTFVVSNTTGRYIGKIERVSQLADLCLIKLDHRFPAKQYRIFRLAKTNADPGEIVTAIGYPELLGPIISKGYVISHEASYDTIIKRMTTAGKTSFRAIGGQSGSPVVNKNGDVVGVVVARDTRLHDLSLYILITDTREFLGVP
jgi:S1-C subfamily serine protease